MKVLVTGGAGYVGSACVRRLVSEGHDVVASGTYDREWEIVAISEERQVGPAALQGLGGHSRLTHADTG